MENKEYVYIEAEDRWDDAADYESLYYHPAIIYDDGYQDGAEEKNIYLYLDWDGE